MFKYFNFWVTNSNSCVSDINEVIQNNLFRANNKIKKNNNTLV